jgi:hypothetical protein
MGNTVTTVEVDENPITSGWTSIYRSNVRTSHREIYSMDSSTPMGLIYKLKEHGNTGQIAFLMIEILTDAGYSDDEIREVSSAMSALVPLMRVE